jgi:hypothetical protein
MTLTARYVPTNFAAQTWPQVEEHVAAAMPYANGDYNLDQIKMHVLTGQWMLIVIVDEVNVVHGALTVSYLNYPNDRIGFVTFIGGKHITNDDTFKQVCDIMKANGATKTQCMARPSAARLWQKCGYEERTTLLEMKL